MKRNKHKIFHCPQLFCCFPSRCSGVPEYASCVTKKLRQNVGSKREYDVILRRHKQRISSTMTTIRHCSILEFGRRASNQAVALGITRPQHVTAYTQQLHDTLMLTHDDDAVRYEIRTFAAKPNLKLHR